MPHNEHAFAQDEMTSTRVLRPGSYDDDRFHEISEAGLDRIEDAFNENQLWALVCNDPNIFDQTVVPSLSNDPKFREARKLLDENPHGFYSYQSDFISRAQHHNTEFDQYVNDKLDSMRSETDDPSSNEYGMKEARQRAELAQDFAKKQLVIKNILADTRFLNAISPSARGYGQDSDVYYRALANEYREHVELANRYDLTIQLAGGMANLRPYMKDAVPNAPDAQSAYAFFEGATFLMQADIIELAYEKLVEAEVNLQRSKAFDHAQAEQNVLVDRADGQLEKDNQASKRACDAAIAVAERAKDDADAAAMTRHRASLEKAEEKSSEVTRTHIQESVDEMNGLLNIHRGMSEWLQTSDGKDFLEVFKENKKDNQWTITAAVRVAASKKESTLQRIARAATMASRTTHTQSFARQEQTQNLCETDHDKAVANYASFSIILTEIDEIEDVFKSINAGNPRRSMDLNSAVEIMKNRDSYSRGPLCNGEKPDETFMTALDAYLCRSSRERAKIKHVVVGDDFIQNHRKLRSNNCGEIWLKTYGLEDVDFVQLYRDKQNSELRVS
jgi:hypothetical protein